MKINYKKICLLFVILMISCLVLGSVEAAVTGSNGSVVTDNTSTLGNIVNTIGEVITYVGGLAASGIFATITSLINVLSISMFLGLALVLSTATGDFTHIPLPDTIVFNRYAFFDPNFVNPAKNSLIKGFGDVLPDLFASFQTVAIAVFIIAAMITGLKIALSSIAAKKAQYKEAALKWVSGFLVLVCLKWILAAIFYTNEYLVSQLYNLTSEDGLKIPIYITDAIPIFGKLLSDLWKGLQELTGWDLEWKIAGYLGILVANMCKSIGGNIVASILCFILMGQTLTIVGAYLKRVFMCLLLGIISPLIVAADTIMSSMGKQSTIFKSWLQNFSVTVFMQSIHAAYMVVVLQILSGIYSDGAFTGGLTETQASIVTIVLTTGLVKLEKLIKSLFGIGDSFAGDLKSGAKGMVQAMGAVRGIAAGAKAVGDNAGKVKDAAKRKQAYSRQLDILKSPERAKESYRLALEAKKSGNMEDYHKHMSAAAEQRRTAKEAGYILDAKGNVVGNKNGASKSNGGGQGDYLQQVINAQNNPSNMTREQQIQQLEAGYAQAQADFKSARLAQIMGPANLAAGIGLGIGMGDDISEALFKGGHITAMLDRGAETIGKVSADKDRRTFAAYEKEQGEKYGYTPSDKIIREKTIVEKTLERAVRPTNDEGKVRPLQSTAVNPIAVGREIAKHFEGIGDVLADTMKKELRRMDKKLDDSQ